MISRPIEILLVEDNLGDIRLIQEVLINSKIHNRISVVRDGAEALNFLYQRGRYAQAIKPDLILLDLNLPKRLGTEVLAEIKNDSKLRQTPVIVLTTSQSDQDIIRAYDLQANCYITKPAGFDQLESIVQAIEYFWLEIVQLPSISD